MKEKYQKFLIRLGVEKSEIHVVGLLFSLSLALGFFHISFELSATTLFLNYYDEDVLSRSLLFSGVLGIVLTFIYSKLQNHIVLFLV
jgi:hypothetical protein